MKLIEELKIFCILIKIKLRTTIKKKFHYFTIWKTWNIYIHWFQIIWDCWMYVCEIMTVQKEIVSCSYCYHYYFLFYNIWKLAQTVSYLLCVEFLSYRIYDLHAVFYFSLEHRDLSEKEMFPENTVMTFNSY